MGAGNYYLENAFTVYVDHEEIYGEWNAEAEEFKGIVSDCDYSFYFREFINTIRNLLPVWFNACEGYRPDGRGLIIAESQFYRVSVVDWEGYFAVNVELIDQSCYEDDAEQSALIEKAKDLHLYHAEKVFGSLAELYPLRVRTSAWTSGLYQPQRAKVA
jgi:hypothetical protein